MERVYLDWAASAPYSRRFLVPPAGLLAVRNPSSGTERAAKLRLPWRRRAAVALALWA